jgi:PKD repeat protein
MVIKMNQTKALIVTALICIISGCSGTGIVPLELSDIMGPAQVSERTTNQYSVQASGDQNPTFQWTLEPDTVGYLTGETTTTVTLHTFELTDDVLVTLTLVVNTTKLGAVIKSTDIMVIDANEPPVALAISDKEKIGDGQSVQFNDRSTDPDGYIDIYNWEWDFSYDAGDGFDGESLEANPSQQFMVAGIYDVQLRITDSSGHMDMLDEALTIEVVTNLEPQITEVIHNRTTSQAGNGSEAVSLEVLFDDEFPADDSWEFYWDAPGGVFDDPTSQTPTWYPPDGAIDCDITVRVTDWFGLYDDSSIHQWVTTLPTLDNENAIDNTIIPKNMYSAFSGMIDPSTFPWPNTKPYGNVVFMGFWASWSSASTADMGLLNGVYGTFGSDDYVHLYVNQGEETSDVVYFVNSNSYDASYWLMDIHATYFELNKPWANNTDETLPMYLLFDRDGHCRWAYVGAIGSTSQLQSMIAELL